MKKLFLTCIIATSFITSINAQETTTCDDFTIVAEWPNASMSAGETIGYSQGGTYEILCETGSVQVNGWIPGIGGSVGFVNFEMSGAEQIAEFTVQYYTIEEIKFSVNGSADIDLNNVYPMTVEGVEVNLIFIEETDDGAGEYTLTFTGEVDEVRIETLESNISKLCVTAEEGDPNVSISENQQNEFSLYPNPTSQLATLNTTAIIGSIAVYDISGKLVYTTSVNGFQTIINLEAFISGIYFLHINYENGEQGISKLVKN